MLRWGMFTFGKKSNSIWVPTGAMILLGVYVSPSLPTVTLNGEVVAVTAAGAVASTTEMATAIRPTIVFEKSIIMICSIDK